MQEVIIMISADLVAKYFLSKDPDRIIFNNNIVVKKRIVHMNRNEILKLNPELDKILINE